MSHWSNQAKQWEFLGAPLKPAAEDIQNSSTWINKKILSPKNSLSVLVLGVTPELIHIAWPTDTTLLAIDYNLFMIELILPKETPYIKPRALLGNWLQLPIADSTFDLVIGDGSYISLAANEYALLSQEIQRVLKPSGSFIMRFFSKPDTHESIELIQGDLFSRKITNFHAFKLRLAIAMQDDFQQGVRLKNIWEVWNSSFKKEVQAHKQQLQWSEELMLSIDTYKESNFIYTFPTMHEIRQELGQSFIEDEVFIPTYQLGNSCPTFLFKKSMG